MRLGDCKAGCLVDVSVVENLVQLVRVQLLVGVVGHALYRVTEILAHLLRHNNTVILFHYVADSALAGL